MSDLFDKLEMAKPKPASDSDKARAYLKRHLSKLYGGYQIIESDGILPVRAETTAGETISVWRVVAKVKGDFLMELESQRRPPQEKK